MPTTLSGRLYLGFGIIILMLCGTAAYSIITVMRLSDITEKLFRHPMAVNEALLTLDGSQSRLQPALLGLLEAKSDTEMASALLLIESLDKTSEDSFSLLQERFLGPKEYLNNLKAILNEIKSLRSEIITLKANGQIGETSLPMQKRAEKLRTAATLFKDLKGFVKAKAVEFNDQASRQANTSIRIIVIVNLLAIAASTGIAVLMITSIRRPLIAAVASTRAIADGHVNRRIIIASDDEIGELLTALSSMQDKLREVVAQIYSGVEHVTSTSRQLTDASRHVAQNNNEQISATESISATIEELSVSIAQMVDNTRETRRMLAQAGESSTKGSDVIYEALNEFNRVSSVIGDSSRLINDLDRQSNEISGIVSVIKNIAEQTNLLALNAAIESARAGEAGRGFAVVADEVRTLAARTTQSTQQVSAMIERIQESTKQAVGSMSNAVTLVGISSSKAQLAGESIGQIKQDSQKTIQVIDEIASSLAEQQAASENIAQHIEQIVQKSQQNTQPILETGSVAKNLLQLAGSLQATVAWFKT